MNLTILKKPYTFNTKLNYHKSKCEKLNMCYTYYDSYSVTVIYTHHVS